MLNVAIDNSISLLGNNDSLPKKTPSIFRNDVPEELTIKLNIETFAIRQVKLSSKL